LDGLRAISILLVLATHMLPLGPRILQLNATAGAMGMSLFFALSGFLIASQLLHNADIHEFMVRRLARIVPLAYAFAFLVSTVFVFDPRMGLVIASFLLNYFPEYMTSFNGHFWSLCVEVHFYLSIAVVVALAGKRALWIVWPACLAVTLLRVSEGVYYGIQTHLRLDEILAGACVATLYQKSWSDRAYLPTTLAVLAGLLWFAASSPYAGEFQYLRPYATGLLLAAALSSGGSWINRFLALGALRYVATISYALYVVHPLTVQGWLNEGSTFDRYVIKRPLSFAMTFAAAHLSTFYWERPWQQMAAQWIQRRRKRLLEQAAA
jgi:peptidoglycan/LPS O-acetylase OafA/YrhL